MGEGVFRGTATAESGDMDFGRPDMVKLVNGLYVDFDECTGYYPLKVYVGVRDSLRDAITWQGPYETRGLRQVHFMASGVWFRFKFVKQGGVLAMSDYTPFVRLQGAAVPSNISETSATLVDVTAADAPIDYELTLNDPLTRIEVDSTVNVAFAASGGTAPYTYAASGLPAGLSLATDGTVTGTTPLVGTFPYTVTATDARGATVTEDRTLVVRLPITLDDTLADGTVGAAYTGAVAATGGTGPYTYAVTSGTLPAGLTLASNGAVTGTPTTAATSAFTVTATDTNGDTGSRAYSVTVAEAEPTKWYMDFRASSWPSTKVPPDTGSPILTGSTEFTNQSGQNGDSDILLQPVPKTGYLILRGTRYEAQYVQIARYPVGYAHGWRIIIDNNYYSSSGPTRDNGPTGNYVIEGQTVSVTAAPNAWDGA
jgi:hypothetical protein